MTGTDKPRRPWPDDDPEFPGGRIGTMLVRCGTRFKFEHEPETPEDELPKRLDIRRLFAKRKDKP